MSKHGRTVKESVAQFNQLAVRHERAVMGVVLKTMMEVVPMGVWRDEESRERLLAEAEKAGKAAAAEMLKGLLSSGVLLGLAKVARSHLSKKASRTKKSHRGAARAAWRADAEAVLRKRRNLDVPSAELVDALVNHLVIDRADDGRFECHQTGVQVASSERNMAAEISRIKTLVLKSRASKGK
ncbi:hypothetical protein [Thauera aminoaromatica]|uniref:hypothetical protein n=1 Tax=Thauera aminoaromatica TaxID=164330 RepID=UPI0035B271AB